MYKDLAHKLMCEIDQLHTIPYDIINLVNMNSITEARQK